MSLLLASAGIVVTAYASLGSGSTDLLTDASVQSIALECGKTPAQVGFAASQASTYNGILFSPILLLLECLASRSTTPHLCWYMPYKCIIILGLAEVGPSEGVRCDTQVRAQGEDTEIYRG